MVATKSSNTKVSGPVEVDESGPEVPDLPVQSTPETDAEQVVRRGGTDGDRFERTFLMSGPRIPDNHPAHRANAAAVVQDAMQRGLHARGDVHLVDTQEHHGRRSVSTSYIYAVPVVPASADAQPEDTVTPADVVEVGE